MFTFWKSGATQKTPTWAFPIYHFASTFGALLIRKITCGVIFFYFQIFYDLLYRILPMKTTHMFLSISVT